MARSGMFVLQETTLTNIVGGKLEQQFQDALLGAAAIFAEGHIYQADKEGSVTVEIPMKVRLVQTVDGEVTAYGSADLKAPKRKEAGRPMWYRDGVWSVKEEEQLNLLGDGKGAKQPAGATTVDLTPQGDGE